MRNYVSMIKVNVFSEEKSWSKKLKKKEIFFNQICKHFPKKFRFTNRLVCLTLLLSNNKKMSGLDRSKKILSHLNEIAVVDFDHSDVVRHPLVSKIVKAYNNNDQS